MLSGILEQLNQQHQQRNQHELYEYEQYLQEGSPPSDKNRDKSFIHVYLAISFPLTTFCAIAIGLCLIYYLRSIQTYRIYDRCTERNAHFKYVFEIVCGSYTRTYKEWDTSIIFDLLDNQMVSVLTIQVPGTTLFNTSSIFMHQHAREQLRLVKLLLFRRKPIRDVKCIRVAHTCSKNDAQIIVFGLNILDVTNAENKFFPIPAMVRYRGTSWALNTTFTANNELNFARMGCDSYDPYDLTPYLSYVDMTILAVYLYGAIFCFGALIPVSAVYHVSLHAIIISFISISSVILIGYGYVKLVKSHVVEKHFESMNWSLLQAFVLGAILAIGFALWSMATVQAYNKDKKATAHWVESCIVASIIVSIVFIAAYKWMWARIRRIDGITLANTEQELLKTLVNKNIELKMAPDQNKIIDSSGKTLNNITPRQPSVTIIATPQQHNATSAASAGVTTGGTKHTTPKKHSGLQRTNKATSGKAIKATTIKAQTKPIKQSDDGLTETDGSETLYMKNRNVNSISQYV